MSKHVTGMCRVGKFLKLWKEKDSADFQVCGNFDENVTHGMAMPTRKQPSPVEGQTGRLAQWMDKIYTSPSVSQAILVGLQHLYLPTSDLPNNSTDDLSGLPPTRRHRVGQLSGRLRANMGNPAAAILH